VLAPLHPDDRIASSLSRFHPVIQRVRRIAWISQAFPLPWSVTVDAASGSMARDMICDQI
jgi:hypothetical protein